MNKAEKIDLLIKLGVDVAPGANVAALDKALEDKKTELQDSLKTAKESLDSCDESERGPWRDALEEIGHKLIELGAVELAMEAFEIACKFVSEKTKGIIDLEEILHSLGAFDSGDDGEDDEDADDDGEDMTGDVRGEGLTIEQLREGGNMFAEALGRYALQQRKKGKSVARFNLARRKVVKIVTRNLR